MTKARDLANAGTALTSVSATELGYLDGVTSAVQTQIDSKIGQATAINPTIVDAKGDIIAATAADTVSRLAVGANNTVLTADSATATGLKWATPAGGLTLIKTQTIGSAVSSVTVTDAFSATYDNYLIIVSDGVGSTNSNTNLTLGSTTSGYYQSGSYVAYTSTTVNGHNINNGAYWSGTYFTSTAHSGHINLQNPYLSKNTTMHSNLVGANSSWYYANYAGFLNNTTSYTAFTLTPLSGTITGGTIRVYGYQNS